MARIQTIEPDQAPWWLRLVYRMAGNEVRKLTGKAELGDTLRIMARTPRLLFATLFMEMGQAGSLGLSPKLKALASLRVSTIVGCPY